LNFIVGLLRSLRQRAGTTKGRWTPAGPTRNPLVGAYHSATIADQLGPRNSKAPGCRAPPHSPSRTKRGTDRKDGEPRRRQPSCAVKSLPRHEDAEPVRRLLDADRLLSCVAGFDHARQRHQETVRIRLRERGDRRAPATARRNEHEHDRQRDDRPVSNWIVTRWGRQSYRTFHQLDLSLELTAHFITRVAFQGPLRSTGISIGRSCASPAACGFVNPSGRRL